MLTFLLLSLWTSCCAANDLTIMVLLPVTGDWPVGQSIAGAVPVAINDIVKRKDLLNGHSLNFVWNDTHCDPGTGLGEVVSHYLQLGAQLNAIIGGGCNQVCEVVGLLAAHWNVPMISWGCQSSQLGHKTEYPTFARTVGPLDKSAPIILSVLLHFNWRRVVILASSDTGWQLASEEIKVRIFRMKYYKLM